MKEISTEITIEGSSAAVWDVLTDFGSYPTWNPFIREIKGDPIVGSKLELKIMTPRKKIRKYNPVVTVVTPNRELRCTEGHYCQVYWTASVFLKSVIIKIKPPALNIRKYLGD